MFSFNREKARELFGVIYGAYLGHKNLFKWVHADNGDAPQHKYVPVGVERGSLKHQQFLFFCSLITYSSQSEQGIQQCLKIYEAYPEIFCRKVDGSVGWLQDIFNSGGFIYPNAIAERWHGSNITLFQKYDGDPLTIFVGKNSIDGVLSGKKEKGRNLLPGFGPKLLSLLALWYEELGLISLRGAFPCDVHIQNQSLGLGIAVSTENRFRTTGFAEFLRREISAVCEENGFRPLLLSHALWFLGARLCIRCRKKRVLTAFLCPVFTFCSGRVSTKLYRHKGEWDLSPLPELPLFIH